jgi:archaellum component FlaC
MDDNVRELDQIQTELDRLHERSQANKANMTAHEAVCEERYNNIMAMMNDIRGELKAMHYKIEGVSQLANTGKTSLKTLLWVGGAIASVTAFVIMIINMLPK